MFLSSLNSISEEMWLLQCLQTTRRLDKKLHALTLGSRSPKISPCLEAQYTPMAVVIDNHLPRRPLIWSYVPDWPLLPRAYIPSESEMVRQHVWRTPVIWRSVQLQYHDALLRLWLDRMMFQMFFVQSSPPLQTLLWTWELSYLCQSVWRWKWFFCLSSYVLQWLWLCWMTDTVFPREIDSRR